jgi:hypothetical protein
MARVPLVQDDDEAALGSGLFDTFKNEGSLGVTNPG